MGINAEWYSYKKEKHGHKDMRNDDDEETQEGNHGWAKERGLETFPLQPFEGKSAETLILNFCPTERWDNKFLLKSPVYSILF